MESSQASIKALVMKIKEEMFSNLDLHSFVSLSAYDTAWLAMIPNPQQLDRPMFKNCLNWVLNNQNGEGFWGESNAEGLPTIDALPATMACMIALKTWNVGDKNIQKGLAFLDANTKVLLQANNHHLSRQFTIVFTAMVELAQSRGLEFHFRDELKRAMSNIFLDKQQILEMEELDQECQHYPPLLSCLEAFPSTYDIDQQAIARHFDGESSFFQSPASIACEFMVTGSQKCMDHLQNLVQRCPNGVPISMYPIDEELIKLCIVNHIQRLGLEEYFSEEIEEILSQVHRSYTKQQSRPTNLDFVPAKLFKDSLAFRLLRMHGYDVTPWSFCWFLLHEDIVNKIEQNLECFTSTMYTVYRATDLMFKGEYEVEDARSLSRTFLEKAIELDTNDDNSIMVPSFQRLIKRELSPPWMARLDHLDHRLWIEENKVSPLWIGNASSYRFSCLHNEKLMQLAVENYELRQSVYRNELEELKRYGRYISKWSKDWGLSDMGFGREKTTYCYFAVAASSSLPHDSLVRLIVAKTAILITVADDFFDMKGDLNELKCLTGAIQRWDGKGLSGHSKIIFDALDELVSNIAAEHLHRQGSDITINLREIWHETFVSWLVESKWSKTGYVPSIDEYLEFGTTSIATHTIVLPASCFLSPSLSDDKLKPVQYETVTMLLMAIARLLNDIQSYKKEIEDGKTNFVLLHLKENPEATMEDSIAYTKAILDEKKKEFLEHVLMDGFNDLPKICKHLHLSCLKVFQMFFNSANLFDSDTELVHDIKKAIYIPLEYQTVKPIKLPEVVHSRPKKENIITSAHFTHTFKCHGRRSIIRKQFTNVVSANMRGRVIIPTKFEPSTNSTDDPLRVQGHSQHKSNTIQTPMAARSHSVESEKHVGYFP
ncbi:unnamed protein product [Ilex paraguariensis]|uniref:ent-kaurene synthase n=1 Tax=Ilex paraguariensis TaxID=185542 RepID=A0ABC8QV73_9AQUA